MWGSPCLWSFGSFHLRCSLRCAHSSVALWLCLTWALACCLVSLFGQRDLWFVLECCLLVVSVFQPRTSLGSLGPSFPLAFNPALLSDICNLLVSHSLNPVCMFIMWQDKGKASPLLRTEEYKVGDNEKQDSRKVVASSQSSIRKRSVMFQVIGREVPLKALYEEYISNQSVLTTL